MSVERSTFFRVVLNMCEGYFCVAELYRNQKRMVENWFYVPREYNAMMAFMDEAAEKPNVELYYCPQLFTGMVRQKEYVGTCPSAWADLDECDPEETIVKPTIVLQSSPGRYQALWLMQEPMDAKTAENLSKRIAYAHADKGADRSGWDLTQLLRVPGTINHKYVQVDDQGPVVTSMVEGGGSSKYRPDDFDVLPEVTMADYEGMPFPDVLPPSTGKDIMEMFRFKLTQRAWQLYENIPTGDWSKDLFALEMICFEAGMSREQVFMVASASACNKFARNGQGDEHLWHDVCRAWGKHSEHVELVTVVDRPNDNLLSPEELDSVKGVRTFVEEYIDWASSLGDAATQYHQGGAFIILSALLAGNVSLPTSFGRVIPNLWFMILADTTLTRKSTAMDLAVDLLVEVDSDAIMATDGSIEGLMTGLQSRPGRPSVFLRDEFSGLIDQMTKKDYYAGMAEVLTKLYDGKMQKRMLRKETIEVRDPVLVLFAGGIKKRVQQLLTFDQVSSGFIPRFLFITAESDPSRVMPLGPPTDLDTSERERLQAVMGELKNHYTQQDVLIIGGNQILRPRKWNAALTEDAWKRYNEFEKQMTDAGLKSDRPDLMVPVYDRLAKSTLKAMVLLAASRQRGDEVLIDVDDVLLGIKYAIGWRDYAVEVINGIGRSAAEDQLGTIHANIKRNPGISRGALMRNYHLSAREADAIFTTLLQRGMITPQQAGKGTIYHAV